MTESILRLVRTRSTLLLIVFASALSTGCEQLAPRRTAKVDPIAEPAPASAEIEVNRTTVRVFGSVGRLDIIGDEDAKTVTASIRIQSAGNSTGNTLPIPVTRDGDRFSIRLSNPNLSQGQTATTTITAPSDYDVDIEGHLGDIVISGFASNIDVSNETGDLEITQIVGNVDVNHTGPSLAISDVQGTVKVVDGPGITKVLLVTGTVEVTDVSGDVRIHSITGNVTARRTTDNGQGSLDFDNVVGNLTLYGVDDDAVDHDSIDGEVRYLKRR